MARVFDPKKSIFIPATGGHPKNAEYRVAWGTEQWDKPVNVTKVQMVYNGTVAGMLSPSFPDNTLDEQSVYFALGLLKDNKYGSSTSKSIKEVLVLRKIEDPNKLGLTISKIEDEIEEMTFDIFDSKKNSISVGVRTELKEQFILENDVYAFLFRVEIFPSR
ncbi:hypothetical protein KB559_10870 [Paenibacillus sp. Marseille-P2973]|uniref:hypothetical protein n=1 Tax=Paenibacillus sp. Marseille-P2973 TaxID=1871032 RepID=UPI001B367DA7|nr:hypothetical protein [Paenibacillus sp. Marseille-P2973]MBQ4899339.1 hypothetical protein [Paenibacillus sp. Marseille-P2973]